MTNQFLASIFWTAPRLPTLCPRLCRARPSSISPQPSSRECGGPCLPIRSAWGPDRAPPSAETLSGSRTVQKQQQQQQRQRRISFDYKIKILLKKKQITLSIEAS